MATALAALGTDHIDTHVKAFAYVLGVPDHIHVEDAGLVEALDNMYWGNADGGDEELGTGVDNYGDEIIEFAFSVIVAAGLRS